jgi:putative ABC transport system substrate-binding protein
MKRRELLTLVGGVAAAAVVGPCGARGQPSERARRVGVILPAAASDVGFQLWLNAFLQELGRLGWTTGENMSAEVHWATPNALEIRSHVAELVSVSPDVILAAGTSTVGPMLQATRTIPIVFPNAVDPVGAGFVDSLARPGGNATGFLLYEYSLGGKWLELLKQVAPQVTRLGVLRDSTTPSGSGQFAAIQTVAPSFGVETQPINMRDAGEIEAAIAAFSRSPNGGLILTGSGVAIALHDLVITLAARHKLPTVYYERFFAVAGGLISYGPDRIDQYRQAARYVDRILKGERAADLPVQAPTKFELVINLNTAKAMGIEVPPLLLARADEVIE